MENTQTDNDYYEKPPEWLFREQLSDFGRTLREQGLSFARQMKMRHKFCQEYLQTLETGKDAEDTQEAETLRLKAHVRRELGDCEEALGNYPEALEMFHLALSEAQQSKDVRTIYAAQLRLGIFFMYQDYDQAVVYFQRSLRYSTSWHDHIDTLHWLGNAWSMQEHTLPLAIAMYDWICQLDPTNLDSRRSKYQAYIRHEKGELVKEVAMKKGVHSCEEAAEVLAARRALWWPKRAIKAAEEGLRVAQEQNEDNWQAMFEWVLK